jgi:flagellin-like hook-associated protein FlgL
MPMPLSGLAQTLSNSVATVQAEIVDTQNQLSEGVKTLNPGQAGVVTRLSAQATGYDQTLTNIGSAQSVISVAQSSLSSISSILTQMQALANQASSASLSTNDRNSLQATFTNLATQVKTLGTSSSVNSNNLLNSSAGITVTTGIGGASSDNTNVAGVDIGTLATTVGKLLVNSTYATPTDVTTADVKQTDTVTIVGIPTAGGTITISGLTFTATSTAPALIDITTAFANYITGASSTSQYGTFSGASVATMQSLYSNATAALGVLTLTDKVAGTQAYTTSSVSGGGVTSAISANAATAAVNQKDDITFSGATLGAGQTVSIDGLVFTAGNSGATGTEIATDYASYVTAGTSVKGTFSGITRASMQALYATATQAGAVLTLTKATALTGVQPAPVIIDAGATNAAAAVASLTTQLQTVSTGQSTLSAAATGLTAQASANTALKTGLTNTVNSIQNIDAPAMQAKLQQLNNQQSIDYYLVSQMNTEAAAILSIFR